MERVRKEDKNKKGNIWNLNERDRQRNGNRKRDE
jgi:hypothetical protein